MKRPAPSESGQRSSSFHPDREAQVTQTVGVNPDPPAQRSASVEADTSPLATQIATGCLLSPYYGLDC